MLLGSILIPKKTTLLVITKFLRRFSLNAFYSIQMYDLPSINPGTRLTRSFPPRRHSACPESLRETDRSSVAALGEEPLAHPPGPSAGSAGYFLAVTKLSHCASTPWAVRSPTDSLEPTGGLRTLTHSLKFTKAVASFPALPASRLFL